MNAAAAPAVPARQAELARLLRAVDVKPVGRRLGQGAGVLAGRAAAGDAADAIARAGDRIMTGDPGGIRALVAAPGRRALVVPCSGVRPGPRVAAQQEAVVLDDVRQRKAQRPGRR
jgi:hypothetical protein